MTSLIRHAKLDRQSHVLSIGMEIPLQEERRDENEESVITQFEQEHEAVEMSDRLTAVEVLVDNSSLVAAESLALNQADHAEILRLERESAQIEGKEQGYREGYEVGLNQGRTEYQERIDSLESIIKAINTAFEQGIDDIEDVAVEIVFTAVCKFLGKALVDRDGVVALVRQVIDHAKEHERITVRVSPPDYKMLKTDTSCLLSDNAILNGGLIADDRISLGGCLLETTGGNLDGRLEIQMKQFRETLLTARTTRIDDDNEV